MKYITYKNEDGHKTMVIFCVTEQHALIAQQMHVTPLSAGFINITADCGQVCVEIECYGESTSLGLTPTEEDSILARKLLDL
jgi:hypothetical protein